MEEINKTNEQLHEEFEEALQILSEKLYALLYYGRYALEYVDRDYETKEVRWANMKVGKHRIHLRETDFLRSKGTEVTINLPDNPVNRELLDAWDKQSIQNDIDYHQRALDTLLKRREELKQ